jgi:hypothetical protein
MSDYGIQFADWCEFPPETMVGETVFDCEGNAIGWIVNATAGKDIERYNGSGRRGTVAILQGGRKPEEVMFIRDEGGVTHYLPEMTCKDLGGTGANGEDVFNCSECGCVLSLYDGEGVNTLYTSFIYDYPRFCPECGKRII